MRENTYKANPDVLWYLFKHLCIEKKEMDTLFSLPHAQKIHIFITCLNQSEDNMNQKNTSRNIHLKFKEKSLIIDLAQN